MGLIYETTHFLVEAPEKPLVDRGDGGHIVITPRVRVADRQQLTPKQAIELIRLTMLTGQAMTTVMNANGVDIGRINYQDNGNWTVFHPEGSFLHIHLYGRAKSAQYHTYGQACYFPHRDEEPEYYARFSPLLPKDVSDLTIEMRRLSRLDKYSDSEWGL